MELNAQIWGDSTEWQVDETINYYDDGKKAYNGKYKSLSEYVTNNIFELNTAIDNTILYCGQAAGVTPWGDRAIYSGFESSEGTTPTPTLEINRQADIALFTVQNNTSHFRGIDGIRAIMDESTNPNSLTNTGYTRWSPYARNFPDTEYPNTNLPNTNYQLCPVVDFDLRCMIGVIYVDVCSTIDGTRSTMTLYDFEHGNYSDYVILYAFMRLALLSGTDSYSIVQTSSPSRAIGFVDMRPIETATGDYINYVESVENVPSIPLFGFNEDRYSWNSNYRCFNTYWGYNNTDTEYTNTMSHAGVLYSASRATFAHYKIQKDYQTYSGLYNVWYYMENNADNLEYLRKAAASYGIWFTDNPTSDILLSPTRWTDNNMMLGILRDGVGYGDYTRGAGNTENPAYNWTSSHQSGYDPSAGHDPNTYSNETAFNSLSPQANLTKRYVLNKSNVEQLSTDLYDIVDDLSTIQGVKDYDHFSEKVIDSFLVTSPIDCIISLKRFPFDIPHTGVASKTPVHLGKTTGNAEGYTTYDSIATVLFEGKKIFPRFGNSFLDYSPYTEYELYIPFCGVTKINAGDLIGHTLNVKLTIDLITGGCTAYIMADNLVIETAIGTCATEMQITGINSAQMDASIQNAITNVRNAKTQQEVTMLSPISVGGLISSVSNPWKTAGSIAEAKTNRVQADYNLQNIQTPIHLMGNAGGSAAWVQEFNCRLMIYYPEGDAINGTIPPELANLETYGHTTGFATVDNATIGSYGDTPAKYVQAINPILDFTATENEKDMIRTLLAEGIYV